MCRKNKIFIMWFIYTIILKLTIYYVCKYNIHTKIYTPSIYVYTSQNYTNTVQIMYLFSIITNIKSDK